MASRMVIGPKKRCEILVLSPHPDDAEFGMGGTILQSTVRGQSVHVLVLTRGEGSPRSTTEKRRSEQLRAAEMGGYTVSFLSLPDGAIRTASGVVRRCRQVILAMEPKILFAPYCWQCSNATQDWRMHPDHLATGIIASQVVGYIGHSPETSGRGSPPCLLSYYAPSGVEPAITVGVGSVMERLGDLLRCFSTQLGAPGRTVEDLLAGRREPGRKMHVSCAERFYAHNEANARSGCRLLEACRAVDTTACDERRTAGPNRPLT